MVSDIYPCQGDRGKGGMEKTTLGMNGLAYQCLPKVISHPILVSYLVMDRVPKIRFSESAEIWLNRDFGHIVPIFLEYFAIFKLSAELLACFILKIDQIFQILGKKRRKA